MKNIALHIIAIVLISVVGIHTQSTSKLFSKIFTETEKTPLDDANCTLQDIDEANALVIYPVLNRLVKTDFFKIFKVDLQGECPYWVMSKVCTGQGSCGVCECDEKDIPVAWKQTKLTPVNTFLGLETDRKASIKWNDNDKNCWTSPSSPNDMTYVNLLMNPEVRTGYSGEEATRIWRAVYQENCFKSGVIDEMCLEERIFYRLLSGIHVGITMKIATYYHLTERGKTANVTTYDMFEPNFDMYAAAIDRFPDRLKNLYFVYSFTLRAIQKASDFFENYDYNTGNATDDKISKQLVRTLLTDHTGLLCNTVFDESRLFKTPDNAILRDQMRSHFRNISAIMDCVSCEKCKMWAKLEMLGLATALKIVLADAKELPEILNNLQRNEIIALFNSFKQHAQSISDLQVFRDAKWRKEISPYLSYFVVGIMVLFVGRLVWHLIRKRNSDTKEKKA